MGTGVSGPFDLLVAGRASVDVIFTGLERWPALGEDIETDGLGVCAGTSFNLPAAANRIGLRVGFITTIGNDIWSRMIHEEFDAEGLPTDFLEVQDRPLPGVSVALNLGDDRGFVTHWGSDGSYDDELSLRALEIVGQVEARHLHAYVDEQPELLAAARRRGMTVSLDSWGGPAFSSERSLAEFLDGADVAFANQAEAAAMTGEAEPRLALEAMAEHCACAVVTLGADGAMGMSDGGFSSVSAGQARAVDTTGAGDCFDAGFLAGWLNGLGLEESLTLGVICSSGSVGDHGGYRGCPRGPELRAIAERQGITLPPQPGTQGDPS